MNLADASTPDERTVPESRGPWERRIETVRPWLAWALAVVPLGWVLIRLSGAGAGTRIEVLLVFTPFAAVASFFCIGGALMLGRRRAAALATVACIGFVPAVAPMFVAGPNAEVDPSGTRLRVMTLNARYGEADPAEVVALVDEHEIDVLGLQELTSHLAEALEAQGLGDRLGHQALHPASGASGMGLYANVAFDEVEVGASDEVDPVTGRFSFGRDRTVEITVVHPLPPLGSWRTSWIHALQQLADLGVGKPDDPTRLLIGDFNATLDQPTFRTLVDAGYRDAAATVGRGWVPTWGPGPIPLLAIDHVLVDRVVHVESVAVHTVSGSDHRAVIATVVLPGASE